MTSLEIVKQISSLQSTGNKYYDAGLFPSQRVHTYLPYQREDDNIFFSTLIAYALLELGPVMDTEAQKLTEQIIRGVRRVQPLYQHWKGEGSYNFWKTNPSQHFPHGWLLHRFRRFSIPDDTDDSCLVHLTNQFSKQQSLWLKRKIEQHYQAQRTPSPLTPQSYGHLKAYPTFFGKKLAPEMDACVMTNVMAFMRHHKFPWSLMDRDSLEFLTIMLKSRDFLLRAFQVSPNYGHPLVILYHITRLVTRFPHPAFRSLQQLLESSVEQYHGPSGLFMELLLLNICRLRLGLSPLPLTVPQDLPRHFKKFYFFQAGMLTAFQNPRWMYCTAHPFSHLKYRCDAYYWTLLLEYQILQQSAYSIS